MPIDSANAVTMMTEAGTPGAPHAMLARWNGRWAVETTMWMSPDGPPMTANSTAVTVCPLAADTSELQGDFMGMPYEGTGVPGTIT